MPTKTVLCTLLDRPAADCHIRPSPPRPRGCRSSLEPRAATEFSPVPWDGYAGWKTKIGPCRLLWLVRRNSAVMHALNYRNLNFFLAFLCFRSTSRNTALTTS
jgi:hypothetical protein